MPIDQVTAALASLRDRLRPGPMGYGQDIANAYIDWAQGAGERIGGLLEPERYPEADAMVREEILRHIGVTPQGLGMPGFGFGGLTVFHGTPHRWLPEPGYPHGRPLMEKIGTGEGNQAYGHGVYFSEAPEIAKTYTKSALPSVDPSSRVDNAAQYLRIFGDTPETTQRWKNDVWFVENRAGGRQTPEKELDQLISDARNLIKDTEQIYKLDLPDEVKTRFIDWETPLNRQTDEVTQALARLQQQIPETRTGGIFSPTASATPEDSYFALARLLRPPGPIEAGGRAAIQARASEALSRAGIPGLQYPAGRISGWTGPEARNFVIWDQDLLNRMPILEIE